MLKLSHLLFEASMEFMVGHDQDVPGSNEVVLFSPKVQYPLLVGKTHGLGSHALKHLREFDPGFVQQIAKQTMQIIKSFKADKVFLYSTDSLEPKFSGTKAFTRLNTGAVLNTLDYINDLVMNHQPLSLEEKQLVPLLKQLENRYMSIINDYINSAVDIETKSATEIQKLLNSGNTIKFTGSNRGRQRIFYFNPTNSALIGTAEGMLTTMFRIEKGGSSGITAVRDYFKGGTRANAPGLIELWGLNNG